jgi:hypothetical protein
MHRFVDDDDGYRQWIRAHPDGFVINTARSPSPAYVMLHRASCRTISGDPARGIRWTRDYIKFCGERAELDEFARRQIGGSANPCRRCI